VDDGIPQPLGVAVECWCNHISSQMHAGQSTIPGKIIYHWGWSQAGLLILMIAIDSNIFGDTFEVSLLLSAILSGGNIAIVISDTFFGCNATNYRNTFRQYY
jgi:hypothetical protein